MSDDTLIRITLLENGEMLQGGLELLAQWSRETDECIWVDIQSREKEDIEPLLEEWFGFHELAAEDSTSDNTLPKYDAFEFYDFFVLRSIKLSLEEHGIDTIKLACFLGRNFLVTVHSGPLEAIESVNSRLPHDGRMIKRGTDFLLHAILDVIVDAHFPLIDQIEERIDQIHEAVFSSPSPSLLEELLHLKRDLNVLRRQSLPQRELFNAISRGDAKFIRHEHVIYFRDLYDHMFRIGESIDVERDLATTTMEAYLSVIANRTNEIMKVLTVFSSILLPINFVAGVYGMNFEHMPELHWKFGYLFAFLMMLSIGALMLLWFWHRGWIFNTTKTLDHKTGMFRDLRHRRPKSERIGRES
jgi:magnesium transporter